MIFGSSLAALGRLSFCLSLSLSALGPLCLGPSLLPLSHGHVRVRGCWPWESAESNEKFPTKRIGCQQPTYIRWVIAPTPIFFGRYTHARTPHTDTDIYIRPTNTPTPLRTYLPTNTHAPYHSATWRFAAHKHAPMNIRPTTILELRFAP